MGVKAPLSPQPTGRLRIAASQRALKRPGAKRRITSKPKSSPKVVHLQVLEDTVDDPEMEIDGLKMIEKIRELKIRKKKKKNLSGGTNYRIKGNVAFHHPYLCAQRQHDL